MIFLESIILLGIMYIGNKVRNIDTSLEIREDKKDFSPHISVSKPDY